MNFRFFIAERYFSNITLSNLFSFKGRTNRYEFFISQVIIVAFSLSNYILLRYSDSSFWLTCILFVLLFLFFGASIVQGTKRCHDIGVSGWRQLIPFYYLILIFKKGEDRDNKYGPNTKIGHLEPARFVNIISYISLFGVAIGTGALILVLSVFNGFEELVLKMYNSFDPDLKITAFEGKAFNSEEVLGVLENVRFESFAYVLEEKALLKYQDKEFIATVKGVSHSYNELTKFENLLLDGKYINSYENNNVAVVGVGVAHYLSIGLGSMFEQLQVFFPNRNSKTLLNPETAFKKGNVLPVGIFSIQSEIDQEYIIVPLAFIQQLTDRVGKISSVEIQLKDEDKMFDIQEELESSLNDNFIVKNRFEQQDFLYKLLNTEKLAVFLILVFIMIIATFNIIGSLSMMMLDKRKDIATFKSLGCTSQDIQAIFFRKSMFTIILGVGIGLFLGLGLSFLQKTFGLIKMDGHFVINTYPVAIVSVDVMIVVFTVFIIGLLASWYPAKVLSNKLFKN